MGATGAGGGGLKGAGQVRRRPRGLACWVPRSAARRACGVTPRGWLAHGSGGLQVRGEPACQKGCFSAGRLGCGEGRAPAAGTEVGAGLAAATAIGEVWAGLFMPRVTALRPCMAGGQGLPLRPLKRRRRHTAGGAGRMRCAHTSKSADARMRWEWSACDVWGSLVEGGSDATRCLGRR
ncbi:MAG: hypothetical protein J3K34DRAFT_400312 [Monoraphidium minutum]|nr:MAG: hypothetical protein J3K34DRAFT_400312 [Monoraphidium minutum]